MNTETPKLARVLTAAEAARELRLSRPSLYRLIRQGVLPAARIGRRGSLRIRPADLEELLQPVRRKGTRTP